MAKKVKCIECENSMDWSIPSDKNLKGNDFLIDTLKNTIVCGYTMKTKTVNHCQYCKHYEHENDKFNRTKRRELYEKELSNRLENLQKQEGE